MKPLLDFKLDRVADGLGAIRLSLTRFLSEAVRYSLALCERFIKKSISPACGPNLFSEFLITMVIRAKLVTMNHDKVGTRNFFDERDTQ